MIAYINLFIFGLQLGATACAISCMPLLSPILLANAQDKSKALSILALFFSSKIFAYGVIAMLAFFGTALVKNFATGVAINKLLSLFVMVVALLILKKALTQKSGECKSACGVGRFGGSNYALMGFFSSFTICLPLSSLLLLSASSSSLINSFSYGIVFGLGAVFVPFLIFYFIIFRVNSEVVTQFKKYKKQIEVFAALMLFTVALALYFEYLVL